VKFLPDEKVEPRKMTVYINPQIHLDAKVFAAKTRRSISEVTETALKEYLTRQANEEKKKK
jgi:predicted HicB family RNase H-like nuclease